MKKYFAYIRVSTVRQGERGSSLHEQRDSIEGYARRHGLSIAAWFQETETAATQGRREFTRMLAELQGGAAQGLIIHKIDRSARNLRDWANLGDLIDRGIDLQFAHDPVDLHSRGGRLSADIQAVVAADYIRNLREEVRKGFYGRLKQGFYPLPAPLGYLNRGKARPKELDPVTAPLIRRAFELYATGTHPLDMLRKELFVLGLRARDGGPLRRTVLAEILHNPFYAGLMRIRTTGEVFQGVHVPLIPQALFDRVQAVAQGKFSARVQKHDFLFRRLVQCATCDYRLVGERQKQRFVYYRCHTQGCPSTSAPEKVLDAIVRKTLALLRLQEDEVGDVRDILEDMRMSDSAETEKITSDLRMRLARCDDRLQRLTDALLDGLIDRETFESRKETILKDRSDIRFRLEAPTSTLSVADRVARYLELLNTAHLGYESDLQSEKRRVMEDVTERFLVLGKEPVFTLKSPFQEVVNWRVLQNCGPYRTNPRTRAKAVFEILKARAANSVLDSPHVPDVPNVPNVPNVSSNEADNEGEGAAGASP